MRVIHNFFTLILNCFAVRVHCLESVRSAQCSACLISSPFNPLFLGMFLFITIFLFIHKPA